MGGIRKGKAKQAVTAIISRVARDRERVIVRRRGRGGAALVPLEDLVALEEMEDRLDARDFRAAKRQWEREGKKTVSWDKLKAELGI